MKKVKVFYDVETTGVDHKKHSIHQLAGLIEVDEEVVEKFNIKLKPHPKAKIEPEALIVGGVTLEQIQAYPPMEDGYKEFRQIICKYIDPYNKREKAWLVGYNNRSFDDQFLRMLFLLNDDKYYGSLFWADSLDTLVLASEYLQDRRHHMPNFQLGSVAGELGLAVNTKKLHDALYDVNVTRSVYRIVTNRDFEI